MKKYILIILVAYGISFTSCEDKNLDNEYPFTAQVLGKNRDCGIYAIKFTNNFDKIQMIADTYSPNEIYIAKNLPVDLQIDGITIKLDVRKIKDSELSICTTLGPSYPWIYVLKAQKIH